MIQTIWGVEGCVVVVVVVVVVFLNDLFVMKGFLFLVLQMARILDT